MVGRYWWLFLVRGLVAIGFGVVALILPEITVVALVILFGAYVLVDGVLDLIMAIGGRAGDMRLSGGHRVWLGFLGLIGIAAGLVAFLWPEITAVALLFVIAWWAMIRGILELIAAWRLRSVLTNEWMWVLTGLLSIVLGVLLIAQPDAGVLALVLWIGVFAIAWGITLCILAFRVKGYGGDATAAPA